MLQQVTSIGITVLLWMSTLAIDSTAVGQMTLYVDDDAAPGGDGLSWDTALTHLQDALSLAAPPGGSDEIHVAQGVYKPDRNANQPNGSGNIYLTFKLYNDVAVRGGYAGLGAADPDARDIDAFETILSGDLAGDDDEFDMNLDDNSRHVVTATGVTGGGVLEGVTIRAGNCGYSGEGGSLYVSNCSPTIVACTFTHNINPYYSGSAVYGLNSNMELRDSQVVDNGGSGVVFTGTAQPSVINCSFAANHSVGLWVRQSADAEVDACSFTDHDQLTVYIDSASASIANCNFSDNRNGVLVQGGLTSEIANSTFSNHVEGAVRANSGAITLTISDCEFLGNVGRGAIEIQYCDLIAKHCTFQGNVASYYGGITEGGAIYNSGGKCTLKDCVFKNNYALYGGAVYNRAPGAWCKAVHCLFQDNIAEEDGGAVCTQAYYGENPSSVFTGCVFFRNEAGDSGGAIYSEYEDLKLTNCTLVRNVAFEGGGIYREPDSILRVYNSIIKNNYGGAIVGSGPRTVRYSNISGGHTGIGNINSNPQFFNMDAGDLRLKPSSPCIDAGRNSYLPGSVITDIDGNPRFVDRPQTPDTGYGTPPLVDMGAYEFQSD